MTCVNADGHRSCKRSGCAHLSRRVRHRIRIILVLFAWFLATGAQWDLGQLFAWGRMFTSYSQDMNVGTALEKTFSGEQCTICRVVQKAKQQQDHGGAKLPETKLAGKLIDLCPLLAATRVAIPRTLPHAFARCEFTLAGKGRAAPPTPPPRGEV